MMHRRAFLRTGATTWQHAARAGSVVRRADVDGTEAGPSPARQPRRPPGCLPVVRVLGARRGTPGARRGLVRRSLREGGVDLPRAAGVGLMRADRVRRRGP